MELGTCGNVPGVQSVIVVTAANGDGYRHIVEAQAHRCAQLGYGHVVYDLGGLGIGEPFAVEIEDLQPSFNGDSLPPATFKAALVQRAMEITRTGDVVCWLDADCIPRKSFVPEGDDWDIAVTLRPAAEVGLCGVPALDFLNSGVVWFRANDRGAVLCELWDAFSRRMKTDQGALNHLVGPAWLKEDWLNAVGTVRNRALVLDATEWNCWHLPPSPLTRVLHFKRGIRHAAVNYL